MRNAGRSCLLGPWEQLQFSTHGWGSPWTVTASWCRAWAVQVGRETNPHPGRYPPWDPPSALVPNLGGEDTCLVGPRSSF